MYTKYWELSGEVEFCCPVILTQNLHNRILLLYTILYSTVKPNGIPSCCNTFINFTCIYLRSYLLGTWWWSNEGPKHVVLIVIKFMRTFTLLCWMVLSIYYNFHTTVWKTQELLLKKKNANAYLTEWRQAVVTVRPCQVQPYDASSADGVVVLWIQDWHHAWVNWHTGLLRYMSVWGNTASHCSYLLQILCLASLLNCNNINIQTHMYLRLST